jgi:hypothetical protein
LQRREVRAHHRAQQSLLAREVQVDRWRGDSRFSRYAAQGERIDVTVRGQQAPRGGDQLVS